MSTIFGIFQTNSEPIAQSEVDRMSFVMNHWNADRIGIYLDNEAMLGNLTLKNTPESLNEIQPYETEEYTITADVRLDNRTEIFKLLSEFRIVSASSPDPELILFLYLKFGERCTDYLIGDFAFAIWDKLNRQLFCARDQMGIKPFFYYHRNNLFAFASEKKGLLALSGVDKSVNEDFVYKLLADIDPQPSENFHRHINYLFPAHQLRVNKNEIVKREYWKLEIPPIIKCSNQDDYIEGFREQLFKSVNSRLRTSYPISVELSGGLDSSGILGMATMLINDRDRLYTFSNVLEKNEKGVKDYPDDEESIDDVLSFNQIKNSVKVGSSEWKYLTEPHKLELFVQSGIGMSNSIWQEPIRRKMQDAGCRVTLSGFVGDEAVSNRARHYHYGFLEEKAYWDFLKISFQKKQYSLPFNSLVRGLIPSQWQHFFSRDKYVSYPRNSYLLDKEIETRLLKSDIIESPKPTRSFKQLIVRNLNRVRYSSRILHEGSYGITHRLEPRYPFADIRLLSYYLSLPTSVLGHPTINRYLYRRAMQGIIPEKVRWHDDKTRAAGIFLLKENRESAKELKDWISERSKNISTESLLQKIDFNKIIAGLDKENPLNYANNQFNPVRSFRAELIIYYFSIASNREKMLIEPFIA